MFDKPTDEGLVGGLVWAGGWSAGLLGPRSLRFQPLLCKGSLPGALGRPLHLTYLTRWLL